MYGGSCGCIAPSPPCLVNICMHLRSLRRGMAYFLWARTRALSGRTHVRTHATSTRTHTHTHTDERERERERVKEREGLRVQSLPDFLISIVFRMKYDSEWSLDRLHCRDFEATLGEGGGGGGGGGALFAGGAPASTGCCCKDCKDCKD